jgi:hypothetical protein
MRTSSKWPNSQFPEWETPSAVSAEVLYLIAAVGWFLYWWLELGFRSWWYGLPIVFIVIAFAAMQSHLLANYERTGDAVRIRQATNESLK